jgi:beta-galactosidase
LERYPSDVPGLTRLAERREQFASLMKQIPEISLLGYPALLSKFASGKESFSADFGGQLIRRKHPDGFLYFFTMLQNHPIDNWISLSIEAQSAVFFNPMTGKKGKARLRTENGRTEIYMQLQPGESIILKTFSGKNVDAEDWNYYQRTNNIPLTGNWQMRFVESDPSVSEIFDLPALGSWTDLNNDTLKINKGTACYSIRFNLNKIPDKEYRLCLGDVRESAVVRVNGQRAGALFAVPFEMNIGQFLKNGENLLEIEVTNLPANRIADYDRKNIEWRIFHEINFVDITYQDTRFDRWQTVPSGLLGPVSLQESMRFFNPADLTIVGTYYYPEHWDESQWERDLKQIKELGFDFVHYAEFAWAQLEPEEGVYDFAWLDRAVNLAAQNNLKVILCTSTATPPVWLTRNHPEILIENENGTKTDHGARQHPSPSNNFYRDYSLKMIDKLAEHYGNDLRVIGWQLDNEPRPVFDYGKDAEQGFREWLKKQYRTVEALNKAWGTAFWSQIYSDFSQINIPRMSQMFMNSHQILDYRRFATEEMVSFLDEQAKTIRSHAKNQWITTNLIPEYEDGHLRQCKELDFHSYTRYMVFGENYGIGRKGYRLGPVERIAKANDFFRPIDGIYGVMELQPGQVNWGKINPQPLPGAVRLWLWHVFAGGSRFTCTYRYRQPIFGTELYHYGIVGPDGITPTRGGLEYAAFIKEIAQLRKVYQAGVPNPEAYEKRRTAILYNHENTWEMQRNKQTSEWNTERHIDKYYDALKHFGAPVDFIDENADFASYPTIIAPAYEMVDTALIQRWQAYAEQGGHLILTCRTGHKTRNGQLFEASFAAPVYPLIGGKIVFYDLLLPQTPDSVLLDGQKYSWVSWGEILSPDKNTEVWANYLGDFYEGSPAIIFHRLGKGTVTYVGVDSQDGRLEQAVLKKNYSLRNIPLLDLPDGVHIEYRDGFGIAVNYSDQKQSLPLPAGTEYVIGGKEIPVAGVAVWKV